MRSHARAAARLLRALSILTLGLVLSSPKAVFGTGDPSLDWFTLETPHFCIHYHAGLEALARQTATIAEEAHAVLTPLLDWQPGPRTHVVLSDFGDSANGSALVIPYSTVNLLGAPPEVRGSLSDYDDWLRGLFYHEYVHILHLDTILGPSGLLNHVFGKVAAPNGALPRWYSEGLATYYESARSGAGRIRNNIFRASLRAAALRDALLSLGAITGAPTGFPGARSWYLYGGHFLAYVAASRGERALTLFNHHYAERLVPYGVNIVARETLGDDLPTLYRQWQTALTADALATWVSVRTQGGPTPYAAISDSVFDHDHLKRRPQHAQLSYLRSDGRTERDFVLLDLETGEETTLFEDHGGGLLSWLPDGSGFVSSQYAVTDRLYGFNDLVLYDVASGRRERLTEGLRAHDPAVSPDGRRVVFAALDGDGSTDLLELDLATRTVSTLFDGANREQLNTPAYLSDGAAVVVSRFHGVPVGQRDLFVFDRRDGSWRALTDDKALDLEPEVDPSGRFVVFSSDRSGVFDLYACELATGEIRRLTRSVTGLFSPSFDAERSRLYATLADAGGFAVVAFELAPTENVLADAPPAERSTRAEGVQTYASPEVPSVQHDYEPWRYLWPRSWMPEFVSDLSLNSQLALTLSGGDPVGYHAWLASLRWNLDQDDLGFGFLYRYTRLPVDLQAGLTRQLVDRQMAVGEARQPYVEDQVQATLDASVPFPDADRRHTLSGSLSVQRFAAADPIGLGNDPVGPVPLQPELGWFNNARLAWSYADVDSFSESISSERGYATSVGLRVRHPALGADYESFDVTWALQGYLPVPFLDNHVLAARLAGGIGWADYRRRGLFVVGGMPEQDIVRALIDETGVGGALLRGYAAVQSYGDRYDLGNLEYRFPITTVDEGFATLPFFLGRLHGALFADYGGAYFGEQSFDNYALGLGGELRMSTLLAYYLPASLRLGYAYGASERGLHHVYFVVGGQF